MVEAVAVAVRPSWSVTLTEMPAYEPAMVGVPPTAPVAVSMDRPGGSAPAARPNVYGARPPVAEADPA